MLLSNRAIDLANQNSEGIFGHGIDNIIAQLRQDLNQNAALCGGKSSELCAA